MKKLLIVLAIGTFAACNSSSTESTSTDTATVVTTDTATVITTDTATVVPVDTTAVPADTTKH